MSESLQGEQRAVAGGIAVIVNPQAGRGRGARVGEAAATALRAHGVPVIVHTARSGAHLAELVNEVVNDGVARVAIVGGDGTLAQVAAALIAADVPLAVIPAGTGNDFARAMGITLDDPAAAAHVCIAGKERVIDVGIVSSGAVSRPFLTVVALGFDARVNDRTNQLRWPPGRARYYLALALELARLRPIAFRLGIDGGACALRPGTIVAIGNTESYGGGMPVCLGAQADDGKLDLVHVAPLSRPRLLQVFPRLLKGQHLGLPEVRAERAVTVDVRAPRLVAFADGEYVGQGECRVEVRASALRVLVPHT